jgi:hypothetical protein
MGLLPGKYRTSLRSRSFPTGMPSIGPTLFATFANRVMPPGEGYDRYVQSLGLASALPEPFEVLARTLGTRATDHVQLLPVPRANAAGVLSLYFLVHGARHVDPDATRLSSSTSGRRPCISLPGQTIRRARSLCSSAPSPCRPRCRTRLRSAGVGRPGARPDAESVGSGVGRAGEPSR